MSLDIRKPDFAASNINGADQPAHLCSDCSLLIAFAISLESIVVKLMF